MACWCSNWGTQGEEGALGVLQNPITCKSKWNPKLHCGSPFANYVTLDTEGKLSELEFPSLKSRDGSDFLTGRGWEAEELTWWECLAHHQGVPEWIWANICSAGSQGSEEREGGGGNSCWGPACALLDPTLEALYSPSRASLGPGWDSGPTWGEWGWTKAWRSVRPWRLCTPALPRSRPSAQSTEKLLPIRKLTDGHDTDFKSLWKRWPHSELSKNYWRRQWQPTPVLLPGKFHEWRAW